MAFLMTVELLEAALRLAAPIGFAAIGELVVQRSGVINVGLEGILLAGAFAGYAAGSSSGEIWVGVSGAILIGSVLAACFAWVTIYKRGDQIVTGMAFNLLLLGLTGVAMQSLYSGDLQIAGHYRLSKPGRFAGACRVCAQARVEGVSCVHNKQT